MDISWNTDSVKTISQNLNLDDFEKDTKPLLYLCKRKTILQLFLGFWCNIQEIIDITSIKVQVASTEKSFCCLSNGLCLANGFQLAFGLVNMVIQPKGM